MVSYRSIFLTLGDYFIKAEAEHFHFYKLKPVVEKFMVMVVGTTTKIDKNQTGDDTDEYVENDFDCRSVFLSLIVITPVMTPGMIWAFNSIALPQMRLNMNEESWFGSITAIASPFGSLFTGFVIDKYGRRTSMLSSIIPNAVGWFLLADEKASLTQLYIGKSLTGFGSGASILPPPVYLAECITVNNDQIRSSVGTWTLVLMTTSGLLVYGLSTLLPYHKVAFVAGLFSLVSLLLISIFIPESPAWLHWKGRMGDAEIAQRRLKMTQPILKNRKDLTIITTIDVKPDAYALKNLMHYVGKIRKREVYTPLMISITFQFFCEFSGLYCLANYMVDVITIYPLKLNPYILSVLGQSTQIIGSLLLTLILPRFGVKTVSVVSFLGSAMGFIMLAFSILFENSLSSNIFNYIHIISIWVAMFAGSMGVFVIPFSILGEIFPMGAKGYASLAILSDSIFAFIILKIFPYIFTEYKNTVFFVFGGLCAGGAVFVATFLPETVGKTIEEINNDFKR